MSAVFYNLYALYLSVIYIGDVYVQHTVSKIQGFYSVEIFRHESAAGVESEILERNAGQRDCGVPQNGSFLSRADRARIQNVYAYIGSLVGTRQNYIRIEAEKLRAELYAVARSAAQCVSICRAFNFYFVDVQRPPEGHAVAESRLLFRRSDHKNLVLFPQRLRKQLQALAVYSVVIAEQYFHSSSQRQSSQT